MTDTREGNAVAAINLALVTIPDSVVATGHLSQLMGNIISHFPFMHIPSSSMPCMLPCIPITAFHSNLLAQGQIIMLAALCMLALALEPTYAVPLTSHRRSSDPCGALASGQKCESGEERTQRQR